MRAGPAPPSCENERTASFGSDLLTGLLVSGRMDALGIRATSVAPANPPEAPVKVLLMTSFRSVDRVAIRLEVQIPGSVPWRMESAVLRHGGREIPLKGWPLTPVPPGRIILVLEREAGASELKDRYDLEVREAGGNRTILLSEFLFP